MVEIYVDWIKHSKMTIDSVPTRWRAAVEKALTKESL